MYRDVLTSLSVTLNGQKAAFSTAVDPRSGAIRVAGIVRDGRPFLSEIGNVDVDVTLEVCYCRAHSGSSSFSSPKPLPIFTCHICEPAPIVFISVTCDRV